MLGEGTMLARIPVGLSASAVLHAGFLSLLVLLPLLATTPLPEPSAHDTVVFPPPIALLPRTAPAAAPPQRPHGGPTLRPASQVALPAVSEPHLPPPEPQPDVLGEPVPDDAPPCLGCRAGDAVDGVPGGGPPGTGDRIGSGGLDAARTAPIRVGSGVEAPRKLVHVAPRYPEIAQRAGLQGTVELECVIDPTGAVAEIRVLGGATLLRDAAVESVRKWRYTPTRLNGVPVPIVMTVTVRFSLRRES
jgi:periplasmic protein TonB